MPTIAEYLKFANLQMASEALYDFDGNLSGATLSPGAKYSGVILDRYLTAGNRHASKFTAIETAKFVDPVTGWKVVEHISNTTTGFSGTLFKNNQTGELVLSFRSTEFIDDAARDNQATNQLEIAQKGWAFGQLSDMETWYQSLKSRNLIDGQLSITGYSLGGHLATAFNLMHGGEALGPSMPMLIKQVVTFNGAGVGSIGSGSAADIGRLLPMVQSFSALRAEAEEIGLGRLLQTDLGRTAYQSLKSAIYANGGAPSRVMVNSLFAQFNRQLTPAAQADYLLLNGALGRILDVYKEAHRVTGLPSGGNPPNPANIRDTYIDAQGVTRLAIAGESLDYQLAVLVTARDYQTASLSYVSGALAAVGSKVTGPFGLTNQFDVVGTETDNPIIYDMVSHSQYHYGQDVQFFIEDQPLTRGSAIEEMVFESARNLGAKLLVPGYAQNDFGDSHSLVLLVDSLAVMDLIGKLDSGVSAETLGNIFKAATARVAQRMASDQGKAEGDALEMVVDALAGILTGGDPRLRDGPPKAEGQAGIDLNAGNTWHDVENLREPLHQALASITGGPNSVFGQLANKLQFLPVSAAGSTARSDFAQFLSLYYLAPFQLKAADTSAIAYLKQVNEALAQTWEADAALTTEDRAEGKASFSDKWLSDRAAMAAWLAIGNTDNAEVVPRSDVTGFWDFADMGTGKKVGVRQVGVSFSEIEHHKVLFGSDTTNTKTGGADVLTGNAQEDFLYGMSGTDILQGKAGNDYLEGGRGNDLLIGGTGNDILNGGQGYDSYVWTTGDGDDTLIDADKEGRILINGGGLKLLVKQSPTTWTTPDGKVTLTQGDTWKLSMNGGGSLDLGASFTDGNYGIYRTEIATGGTIIRGDLQPLDDKPNEDGLQLGYDGLGNVKVTTTEAPGREDRLYGSDNADTLLGLEGNDIINGRGGADYLEGGSGSDILIGDAGNDMVYGLSGPAGSTPLATSLARGESDTNQDARGDWVDGQAGDDIMVGTAAKDLLTGGLDNDLLIGGAGNDLLLGDAALATGELDWSVGRTVEHNTETNSDLYRWTITRGATTQSDTDGGADVLYGGRGDDWLIAGAGDDLLDGGTGDDVLFGEAGNDVLLGGAGADVINGDSAGLAESLHGADWIDGGAGNDRIFGMAGDDVIIGGKGDDYIVGGKGRDTYLYNKGDGIDEIWDDDTGAEKSILVFGEGVDKDAIKLRKGSLLLDLGNGDAIHIDNWDQANPLSNQTFASFQFADGTSLSWAELLQRGFDLDGTDGDDTLVGTGVNDRLDGRGGNDLIYGLAGNDILTGGTGTDGLSGGAGDDSYVLNAGDSPLSADGLTEVIVDQSGVNTVRFGAGITAEAIGTELDPTGRYLFVTYGAGDKVAVEDGAVGNVAEYNFADGQRLSFAELIGRTAGATLTGASLTGAHFAMGGKANDVIESGAGGTLISGGRGNDTISGGGGGNTYLYSRGDGADILNESGQALDAGGNPAPNRIRFGADIALADLVFARRADGALHIGIGGSLEGITLPNWYSWDNRAMPRIQELVFEDGSVFETTALNGLAVGPIEGTAGNDVLVGTRFNDTILGGAGNDIIDGGMGDDILIGGEGADSYVFDWESVSWREQIGVDTIIEANGESSTLLLQRGMILDLFRAERLNDDLRFRVRGGEQSVLIKDYFAGNQQWSIKSFDGSVTSMSDFLARPDPDSGDLLSEAWNDFNSAARWEWISWYEAQGDRWQLLADGRYYESATSASVGATVSATTSYTTEHRWAADGSMYTVETEPNVGNVSAVAGGSFEYTQWYEGFGAPLTTLDTSTLHFAYTQSTSAQAATFQMQWTQPGYALTSSHYQGQQLVPLNYVMDANGNLIWNEWAETMTYRETYGAGAGGSVTGISDGLAANAAQVADVANALKAAAVGAVQAGGSGGALIVPLPSAVAGTHNIVETTFYSNEHHGTAANEFLYTDQYFAVDGGAGDDIIISSRGDSSLAFGGDGNDKIFGSYGSSDVLNGGRGNDYLGGMGGDDTYLVARGQTGHDVIDEVVAHYSVVNPSGWTWAASNPAVGGGSQDTVRFGSGIALADLKFSYGLMNSRMVDAPATAACYETLNISWAPGESIHVVLPDLSDPATAAAMAANPGKSFGIEWFRFDDGTVLSMDAMRQRAADPANQAPPEYGVPYLLDGGITGTPGNDSLVGSNGVDYIDGLAGDDFIDGQGGGDFIDAGAGNDSVAGGPGNDQILGGGGNDQLHGGEGNDMLDGGDDSDALFGEAGNDSLIGGTGNDDLTGGTGDDLLAGGDGDDVYYYSTGDGNDSIVDSAGTNRLVFNDILWGQIRTGASSLQLMRLPDGSELHLDDFNPNNPYAAGGIEYFQFADGTVLTKAQLIDALTVVPIGTPQADLLNGTPLSETIQALAGDDTVYAGDGNDVVYAGDGDDLVYGGNGNDVLLGEAGNDFIDGQGGDDQIIGGGGSDQLRGGDGNDTLLGGEGNDLMIGGLGDDLLNGGEGDDIYFYQTGGGNLFPPMGGNFYLPTVGNDRIVDSGGTDRLVFPDITWSQLKLGTGSLKLSLPDGGTIHLDDFDPDNPYAAGGIEYFQFAGGVVMTKGQLIDALGIAPTGTPNADVLSGTALSETIQALAGDDVVTARAGNDTVFAGDGNDVVHGGEGDDIIYGGTGNDVLQGEAGTDTLQGDAGNDLLSGGAGTDQLMGGEGDDTYVFQSGDGQDTVTDALGQNVIAPGAGLALDAIVFSRAGDDLLVAIKNSTDRLTVNDWFAADNHFAGVTLGDGTVLDHAGVEAAMPRNLAPLLTADSATASEDNVISVAGNVLANDSDPEGRVLRVTTPGNYAGAVGSLSLGGNGDWSYSLANGTAAVQSLADGQSLTESFAYTATDDDPNGAASAESSIRITVQGANDLPVLGADSAAITEDAGPISGNLLTNDMDVDVGTVLTIADPGTKVGAYGALTLAADGAYSYSLATASNAVQALAAGQVVTEDFAQSVSDGIAQVGGTLAVSVTGRNDAPIVASALADQSTVANTSWTWQLPAGSFTDIDAGDVLGYDATLADGTPLPGWLSFSAATQTFSGSVPVPTSGSIDIRVAATDGAGAIAADVFTLSFAPGGDGDSHGNEGVGNGVDAPPPGHDLSFNDGVGTGPGNPGAQGGDGYRPPNRADIVMTAVHSAGPDTLGRDKISDIGWLTEAAWAYLDRQGSDAMQQATSGGDAVAAFARWLAVEQALAREADGGMPDWLDRTKGADVRSLLATNGGFLGSNHALGSDMIGLLAGAELKAFKGLGEGLQKIA